MPMKIAIKLKLSNYPPGILAKVLTAINGLGGNIVGVELFAAESSEVTRGLIIQFNHERNLDELVSILEGLQGVTVISIAEHVA